VDALARRAGVGIRPLVRAASLRDPPAGEQQHRDAQWVHFGYRDGLARIAIKGWSRKRELERCKPVSTHAAGEFLLGHPQDSGANPWIAGPGLRVWPEPLRDFFRNGSFGVLHQIEQDVEAFDLFVKRSAQLTKLDAREIKGKLCGRYPDGRLVGSPPNGDVGDDFDYAKDCEGDGCPFGSHVRRMNPRGEGLPHSVRTRPLLRRGMPYGPPWQGDGAHGGEARGLMAQFFCASIEDQFEHLVAQWGDRVPLGSEDGGGARDPLVGAHEPGDGPFQIPLGKDKPPLLLQGLRPFTRTAGVAYLFYPSLPVLEGIAREWPWYVQDEDDT
jgi:deferrochelatase/peroxidase EfeB